MIIYLSRPPAGTSFSIILIGLGAQYGHVSGPGFISRFTRTVFHLFILGGPGFCIVPFTCLIISVVLTPKLLHFIHFTEVFSRYPSYQFYYSSVCVFPREKTPRPKKRGECLFPPTCHRKWCVFVFPQPGRRLPFRPTIEGNASETKGSLHFWLKSAPTGLAAGRPPTLQKLGCLLFPTLVRGHSRSL